jgi:tRNA pseudouridine55 synthase
VRTLCADIGSRLGCGAHLFDLRRVRSGRFDVSDAVGVDVVKAWTREQLLGRIIPLVQVLTFL